LKPWSQLRLGRRPPDGLIPELPLDGDGARPLLRPRAAEPERVPQPAKRSFLQPLPLAGVALVLVAIVGYLSVYSQATQRTQVLVAARDLPAGTVLRTGDLRNAGLAGDGAVLAALVPARQASAVVGRRVVFSVPAGQPLPLAALAARRAVPSAFTIAVPAIHALGGGLRTGDRVSVLATFESAAGGASTRAVARGLEVLAVGQPPTGLDRATAQVPVTLALPDPSVASSLALAGEAGKIDLLREGTNARDAPIPSAEVGG
jgi:Flp pilus assembly protein CpaB